MKEIYLGKQARNSKYIPYSCMGFQILPVSVWNGASYFIGFKNFHMGIRKFEVLIFKL